MPSHSFGTGSRDVARLKVFSSPKMEKLKAGFNSPGPVYNVPSSVGTGPHFGFGVGDARAVHKASYPDSSIDLTCAVVDSQVVKFPGTPGVHFGTEERLGCQNNEIVRTHPGLKLGLESPGLEYSPRHQAASVRKDPPSYSFGPHEDRPKRKPESRVHILARGSPRHTGPGSHILPAGIGAQAESGRPSAAAFSISPRSRRSPRNLRQTDIEGVHEDKPFSSVGKQVLSGMPTSPRSAFTKGTRDQAARAARCLVEGDTVSHLPKQQLRADIPAKPAVSGLGI